jgi:hypothetical protein
MATGVSKTRMNGNLQVSTSENGNFTYRPIWQNGNAANRLYFGDNLTVMNDLLKKTQDGDTSESQFTHPVRETAKQARCGAE